MSEGQGSQVEQKESNKPKFNLDKKERNKILGAIGFLLLAVCSGVGFVYLQIISVPGAGQ